MSGPQIKPSATGARAKTLRALLYGLGASTVMIATSVILLGAGFTARLGERTFTDITGLGERTSASWPPTMDNELRFYAALLFAYGVLVWRAGARLDIRSHQVPWLAGVFFLGGAGRLLSWTVVGAPHPFFLLLMTIELTLPLALLALWRSGPAAGASEQPRKVAP